MKKSTDHNKEIESRLYDDWNDFADKEAIAAVPAGSLDIIKRRIDRIIDGLDVPGEYVRRLRRWKLWCGVAACAVVVLSCLSLLLVYNRDVLNAPAVYTTVKTLSGERATVTLSDGTTVTVNQLSSLTYPSTISVDSIREVTFTGEAYFTVTHATDDRPFRVVTPDVTVNVTGTEFNVKAYPEAPVVTVSLDRGSVSLISNSLPVKAVDMKPGDVACYDRYTGVIQLTGASAATSSGWLRHQVAYCEVQPDSLVRAIEKHYRVKLSFEARTAINERFTGSLPDDNLPETLTILGKLYRFNPSRALDFE